MLKIKELREKISTGALDETFARLYGDQILWARDRYLAAVDGFAALFGDDREMAIFSSPGRTEIGGNHTDHNGGRVLAGSVNLDVIAVVSPTSDGVIYVHSKGYKPDIIKADDLTARKEEEGKSISLLRGVAKGFLDRGLCVGGYVAYTESCVPKGSGVSSSAAFEVLLGSIQNHLYNGGRIPPMEIAKISQFAERDYFGKPCGLMDQAASAMGGICMMDFADEKSPEVTPVPFSFDKTGYKLCLVNVGGDHADLTHLYAAIPERMKKAARIFGKEKLCHISLDEFLSKLPAVREKAGDEAALAALHFCMETDRVIREKDALVSGDFDAFLKEVIASGNSSFQALGNVWIPMEGANQGAAVALALAAKILSHKGAWRIHGGGFGGTTQNFVPDEKVPCFKESIEAVFGKDSCQVLSIRPVGPVRVI